jgi:site-specific recombinase XerD
MGNLTPSSGKTYVVDEVDEDVDVIDVASEDSAPATEPKKAGRPRGSLGRVNDDHDLTLSDFSFMRAVVQGIDPKKAALRYLHGKVYLSDAACAEHERRLRVLLQRTIKVFFDESQKSQALRHYDALMAPVVQAVAMGPSLEDFAQRFDSDMYSERELQELYAEEYGDTLDQGQDAGGSIKSKLAALNWLAERVALKPDPLDPIERWIELSLVSKLRAQGVISIGNLMDWVNLQGRSFYLRVKGLGVTRARRLALWLMDNEDHIGRRLNRRIRFQAASAETALAVIDVVEVRPRDLSVQVMGIVPLEVFAWPVSLQGNDGVFRGQGPNTLGVSNDKEAIEAWFATLAKTASTQTQVSYQRAIERLVLWAIVERRTPLSSLFTAHFLEFREFLRTPPPHWCSRFPTVKTSPDWRPLRGPMKEVSIQQTFSAISSLFAALNACGYLTANAVSSVRTSTKRDLRMDVMRSFSEEDLQSISATLHEMADGPHKRRLRAIILLLQTGGFRRNEAISLRYGDLTPVRAENRLTNIWVAKFVGKGGVERKVPIKAETYEALQDHYRDRKALMTSSDTAKTEVVKPGPLAAYVDLPYEDTPLLGVLDDRFSSGRPASVGDTPGHAGVKANMDGGLSYGRVHSILKSFFEKVSQRDDLPEGHADFLKASAHWMRHTFGHQAMIASKGDLAGIQQILGHADISTTGIYLKADLASRVAIVQGVQGAV